MSDAVMMTDEEKRQVADALIEGYLQPVDDDALEEMGMIYEPRPEPSDTETKAICASVGYIFDPTEPCYECGLPNDAHEHCDRFDCPDIRPETQSAGAKLVKEKYSMTVSNNPPVMREARIILPLVVETWYLYKGESWLENVLTQAFGGFTRQRGVGGSVDPEGHNVVENVYIYDVAMLDTVSSWQDLRTIAQRLAVIVGRQSIYVRSPAGIVFELA